MPKRKDIKRKYIYKQQSTYITLSTTADLMGMRPSPKADGKPLEKVADGMSLIVSEALSLQPPRVSATNGMKATPTERQASA